MQNVLQISALNKPLFHISTPLNGAKNTDLRIHFGLRATEESLAKFTQSDIQAWP